MDIQTDLQWIHQEIDKVKDPTFIHKLKTLLQFKDNNLDVSNEDYNEEIKNALENIDNGNYYSENEARLI